MISEQLFLAGLDIGRAFQLQDDLIDVYGDADRAGKSCLQDAVQGKPTVFRSLCVERMTRAGATTREALTEFCTPGRAAQLGERLGAREDVTTMIDTYARTGWARLAALPFAPDVWSDLERLRDDLRGRQR